MRHKDNLINDSWPVNFSVTLFVYFVFLLMNGYETLMLPRLAIAGAPE